MNYKLNTYKLVCSIFVVLLHITSYIRMENLDTFYNFHIYVYVLNIAVPIFFTINGFFLLGRSSDYLIKYSKKILTIQVFSSLFYFTYNIVIKIMLSFVTNKDPLVVAKDFFQSRNWISVLNGQFGEIHLWYFNALLISLLVFSILKKVDLEKFYLPISVIVYILYLSGWIPSSQLLNHGGFIKAMFYMSLGYEISKSSVKLSYTFFKGLLSLLTYVILINLNIYGIREIFLMLATFYFITHAKQNPGSLNRVSEFGRQHSEKIFVYHLFVYHTIWYILQFIGVESHSLFPINLIFYLLIIIPLSIYFGDVFNNFIEKRILKKTSSNAKGDLYV